MTMRYVPRNVALIVPAWICTILASCTAGPRGQSVHGAPSLVGHEQARVAAPEFVLETSSGDLYALGERRGTWVVVHLFPRVDTPDCACDMTAFTDHLWRFGSLDVEVVGITSLSRERAARYAKKYGITAPILCDTDLSVTRSLGAFDPNRVDPVVRTTLLVNPDGEIARRWDDVNDPDHIESILRVLERLRS